MCTREFSRVPRFGPWSPVPVDFRPFTVGLFPLPASFVYLSGEEGSAAHFAQDNCGWGFKREVGCVAA